MNHKILDQFLDEKTSKNLIDEAKKYSENSHIKVQNNRLILPSSGLDFLKLIEKSISWKNLHDKLNSKEFLNTLTNALNIKNHDYIVTNFLILNLAIYLSDIKKLILENFPLLEI